MAAVDKLPAGYFPVIADAINRPKGSLVNLVGVVTDIMPPATTRTGEIMATSSICDEDFLLTQGTWRGSKVRFFRKVAQDVPDMQLGDIVIYRNIRRMEYAQAPLFISSTQTTTSVLPFKSIPSPDFSERYLNGKFAIPSRNWPSSAQPSVAETLSIIRLKNALGNRIGSEILTGEYNVLGKATSDVATSAVKRTPLPMVGGPPLNAPTGPSRGIGTSRTTSATRSKKFALMEQVQAGQFCDFVCEVVKFIEGQFGYTDLYVSDYTVNKDLYDYPAPEEKGAEKYGKKDWPGPFGQRVLKIEVAQPHMSYLQTNIKEKDIIEIKNTRIKISRQGSIEANLFRDHLYPEKICIAKLRADSSDQARMLLERRATYWRERARLLPKDVKEKKLRRSAKKTAKETKRAEEREDLEQRTANRSFDTIAVEVNPHVKCANHDVGLSDLTTLLSYRDTYRTPQGIDVDLPFTNQRRKMQLRVIDYYPADLRDWTTLTTLGGSGSSATGEDEMDVDGPIQWRWNFFLLVQDAARPKHLGHKDSAPDLWLHVSKLSAEYLLQLNACDFRNKECELTLLELIKHVDILCGNLRELKEATRDDRDGADVGPVEWTQELSNRPFECCVIEYGQQIDAEDSDENVQHDWLRIHELAETTIV